MQYPLTFPEDSDFDLNGGRQLLKKQILTISREIIPEQALNTTCPDLGNSLNASPYIQSNDSGIQKLTSEIIDEEQMPVAQVEKIGQWVFENIAKRPVLGLPDALTTLESRQGDCNEHAALFAALARAASVPTRIVAGVTYHKDAFYYHAWNEVCLGERWISIDTTTNQFPADLTHIRFIQGEMQEQVRIGGLLGRLGIEPVPTYKKD